LQIIPLGGNVAETAFRLFVPGDHFQRFLVLLFGFRTTFYADHLFKVGPMLKQRA
jgi:hypothetical protein